MRVKALGIIILLIVTAAPAFCQDSNVATDFQEALLHHFESKDHKIVDVTIAFFKQTKSIDKNLAHVLVAFYSELFRDETLKIEILSGIDASGNDSVSRFFHKVAEFDIDEFYNTAARDSALNDMFWASYFASGDEKYLEWLLDIAITYSPEREDLQLFLAGESALWSLSSNAGQYPTVKSYLENHKERNPEIVDYILNTDPDMIISDMKAIVAQQRADGKWQ